MTIKFLPEHAQATLLALDLARKEASHLRYSLQQATRQAAAPATSLAQRIHNRFAPLHTDALPLPSRQPMRPRPAIRLSTMAGTYLIDTNVISELMRAAPEPAVMQWFEAQTDAKIVHLGHHTGGAADWHCHVASRAKARPTNPSLRRTQDRPISTEDAQIAAIALAQQLTLVTRNTRDFAAIDALTVVNPWMDAINA